ncbi:hypothetical protein Aspvir_009359 [Aspergillus viridinutans]|uniref:Glycosyltransferase family 34 protein n=1 Tax=Aspergillus viridinutans TaxID=75553 RepID=A0A9P3BYB2_ASPVI|nr:uncharacterized protein Aspvir_009359 [Aspergillus viridinutans]GIK05255.1 hypothetical protein Aspvir_009359 [Aspergillus viridinutans]
MLSETESELIYRECTKKKAGIAKVSILYGDSKPAYERALRTHEEHNRLHCYSMRLLRTPILDGYWTKPAYILSVLLDELGKPVDERLRWLMWFDADTVILNYKLPLEMFLPPEDDPSFNDVHLLVTHDLNGFNNGVFPIRVSSLAVELLADIVAYRDFRGDTNLAHQDQTAMANMLQESKFSKHVINVPQRWFNAYKSWDNKELQPDQVHPGDLLVHFAGIGDREKNINRSCELSEMHDPEWDIDATYTAYPREVSEFWASVKEERLEQQ